MAKVEIRESKGGISFDVRAHPGAGRSGVAGVIDGALKVDLKSPPEDGKANRELVKLLAKKLGVRAGDVEIISGAASRRKVVRVAGIDAASSAILLDGL